MALFHSQARRHMINSGIFTGKWFLHNCIKFESNPFTLSKVIENSSVRSRNTLVTQASFEMSYIKGRVNLNILDSQTYNEVCV